MVRITVSIEGMVCGMCEAHINEAVRNAFRVKKVTSSHTKKQTVILAEQDILEQELKSVVAKAGYDVVSVNSVVFLSKAGTGEGNRNRFDNAGSCAQKKKALYGPVLHCDAGCAYAANWPLEQGYGF